MTHFLLVESPQAPTIVGVAFKRVTDTPYLVAAARANFEDIQDVWVARPDAGEADLLVENANQHLAAGGTYAQTELAAILTTLTESVSSFALFWASYPEDLPVATSTAALHEIVQNDLANDGGLREVYVLWRRA